MTLEGDTIVKEKLSCGLENDLKIWLIFMKVDENLKIFILRDSSRESIAYKVSTKTGRKSHLSRH